jgi:hypothetical protein
MITKEITSTTLNMRGMDKGLMREAKALAARDGITLKAFVVNAIRFYIYKLGKGMVVHD